MSESDKKYFQITIFNNLLFVWQHWQKPQYIPLCPYLLTTHLKIFCVIGLASCTKSKLILWLWEKITPALRKMPLTSLRNTIWTGGSCHKHTIICCATYSPCKNHTVFPVPGIRNLMYIKSIIRFLRNNSVLINTENTL